MSDFIVLFSLWELSAIWLGVLGVPTIQSENLRLCMLIGCINKLPAISLHVTILEELLKKGRSSFLQLCHSRFLFALQCLRVFSIYSLLTRQPENLEKRNSKLWKLLKVRKNTTLTLLFCNVPSLARSRPYFFLV